MRLLLIDDDELSRAVLELHLTAAGYELTEAESGDAAVALLQEKDAVRFDVVLSDLQMPGLHGPALARALREITGGGVPLLAMSGSQPPAEAYEGFDGFLLKPFAPAAIELIVRGLQRGESEGNKDVTAVAPVLDEATFTQLQSMMTPTQMEEIFQLSMTELEKQREAMEQAFAAGDMAGLRASAHAMKGGFSILGAAEIRDLGATLESGTGSPPDIAATLREIPYAAERLRRMLTSRGLSL